MAAGSIIIDLLMRTGSFETDTKRAERALSKFKKEAEQTGKVVGTALAAGAIAAAYGFDTLLKSAADLKDLEEVTGIPAELIGSFGVAAGTAGASLDSIGKATVLLTKNLQGVGDESKAAGAALTALGIPIEDFRRLNPGEQIEAVSKALAGFEDGAQKTAVATALFGKSGAELLPFLKTLEEQGGRQIILTQEQIELADEYADKQAKVIAELRQYAQLAATQALPAINALTEASSEFVTELIGVDREAKKLNNDSPVAEFAEKSVRALGFVVDAGQGVVRVFQTVGTAIGAGFAAQSALLSGDFQQAKIIASEAAADIDRILSAELFSAKLNRSLAESRQRAANSRAEDRGFAPQSRPRLEFDGKEEKAAKERASEAERYLESLRKQAEQTLDLTAKEQALLDIQSGRLKGLTPDLERAILAQAEFNDLNLQAIQIRDSEVSALTARSRAQLDNLEALQKGNEELREEIALIGLDELGIVSVERARISSTRALKEEELARRSASGAADETLQVLEAEIAALREREALLGEKIGKSLEQRTIEEAKRSGDAINSQLAESIEDGILDGFRSGRDLTDIFLDELKAQFAKTVLRPLIEPVAKGGNDLIAQLIGSAVGAFSSGGSGIVSGDSPLSGTGELIRGRREIGGDVHPGGDYLVGEKGPERFRPSTSGRIIPNGASMGGEVKVEVSNNGQPVTARATSQQTDTGTLVKIVLDAVGADLASGTGPASRGLKSRGVNLNGTLPRRA